MYRDTFDVLTGKIHLNFNVKIIIFSDSDF